jgi:CTD small phosphatase-like protein 2
MSFPDGQRSRAGVNLRPYVKEVLKELRKDCEIIVFTASHENYMKPILQHIDPYGEIFDFMFHRESCVNHYGMYLKDLRIFGNRDLSQMVLIDNATYSFSM